MSTSGDAGGSYGAPLRLGDAPAGHTVSSNPAISAGTGESIVIWEDDVNGRTDLFGSVSTDRGDSYDPPRRVDSGDARGSGYSLAPQIAAAGHDVAVAWVDTRFGAERSVFLNVSTDDGDEWLGAAVPLDVIAGRGEGGDPTLVLFDRKVEVAWRHDAHGVRFGRYDLATGAVEEAIDLHTQTGGELVVSPQISHDHTSVVVGWATDTSHEVLYTFAPLSAPEQAAWSGAIRLNAEDPAMPAVSWLSMATHRDVVVGVWAQDETRGDRVVVARAPLGQGNAVP